MRLLLDTHVLLWAMADDPSLSKAHRDALEKGTIYLSAASVWEIGIKRALGKLDVPSNLFEVAQTAGCRQLPISWQHAQTAAALPPLHGDPFDRMLISQAICEGLTLLSSDKKIAMYEVDLIR